MIDVCRYLKVKPDILTCLTVGSSVPFTGAGSFESSWGERGACWGSPWPWHAVDTKIQAANSVPWAVFWDPSACTIYINLPVQTFDGMNKLFNIFNNKCLRLTHNQPEWLLVMEFKTIPATREIIQSRIDEINSYHMSFIQYILIFTSHVFSSQSEGASALAALAPSWSSTVPAISCG